MWSRPYLHGAAATPALLPCHLPLATLITPNNATPRRELSYAMPCYGILCRISPRTKQRLGCTAGDVVHFIVRETHAGAHNVFRWAVTVNKERKRNEESWARRRTRLTRLTGSVHFQTTILVESQLTNGSKMPVCSRSPALPVRDEGEVAPPQKSFRAEVLD